MAIIKSAKRPANNFNELFTQIKHSTVPILEELAVEVQRLWKEYIEERFYDAYDPWVYQREYAILEAIVKTDVVVIGNLATVSVFIDMGVMNNYHPNMQSDWQGRQVVEMIEKTGMTLKNGVIRDPAYAYESIVEWLRKDYEKFLKSRLNL